MAYSVTRDIGGRPLIIETGSLAGQAGGAVTVTYGETVVLVTACLSAQPRESVDFLPLTVDYEERLYAAGKIPGGFIRREGRPTQEAVLAMRLTDRSIRPLFPKGLRHEIQAIITALSADQENDPDIMAIIGASAALGLSPIPFQGPISATRMGYSDGQFLVNPTFTQLAHSDLDLVVAGTRDAIVMVEAGAQQVPESMITEALRRGQEINQQVMDLQEDLFRACAKPKVALEQSEAVALALARARAALAPLLEERLRHILSRGDMEEQEAALVALEKEALALGAELPPQAISAAFQERVRTEVRAHILGRGVRSDGRGLAEIRPIEAKVGILPRTHGSGLFTRGQTQVLTIATLGSMREEQRLDGISPEESKRFMHHYNFPPFSVGETRRLGAVGRREIGHGALAERALAPVIPSEEEFAYTIRLVSEVLSSNGSTSMASVCGSTLSLMDAGVPIKAPVAGVAMGLVMGDGSRYALLTDIAGAEDALGDMDFKVAGTAQGITALQMDLKVKGITLDIVAQALAQAREARLHILEKMRQAIATSRPELSKYAPRMYKIKVDPDKIRFVIGPGGRTIRTIQDETKTTVDVENDGTVIVGSPSEEAANKAIKMIRDLTRDVEVGGVYTGRVTRVVNFGAFVEILPGKEGLVRLGELADYPAPSVEEVVKVGDEIMVMVIEIDSQGRVNLSRRAILQGQGPTAGARPPAPPQPPRPARPQGPRPHPAGGPQGERRYPEGGRRPMGPRVQPQHPGTFPR